ncbi:hypothetical protein ACO2Q8_01735 [Larkinella sp. VNQ87]|uniref:hypothetical protein n=1 Tax=Larkinella sp. VNQ87 TaxID=3400921 RepID=UPI003BFD8357
MAKNLRYFILINLLLNTFLVQAQGLTKDSVSSQPKWEVGTDLLGLLNKNTLPNYSLLVRRKVGRNGAFRLRGGYIKNSEYIAFRDRNYNQASLLRIGYEHQKILTISKGAIKSRMYGGIDLFSRYQRDNYSIWDIPNPEPYSGTGVDVIETTQERGGAALIGFQYFVTRFLSLSIESSFQISRVFYSQNERGFASGYHTYLEFPRNSYQFIPINTIGLSFHF